MTQSLGLSGFGMLILAAKTIESNDTTAFNSVAPVNYYNVQAPQVASSETARPRAHGYVLRNTASTPTPSPVVLQTPREEAEPPAPSPARGGLKRVTRKGVPQKIARATPPRAAKAKASGNAAAVEPPQKETVVTRKTTSTRKKTPKVVPVKLRPRWQCPDCSSTIYPRKYDIRRHQFTHLAPENRPHKCDFEGCTFTTVQKSNLDTHLATHERATRVCGEDIVIDGEEATCPFRCTDPGQMTRHRQKLHGYPTRAEMEAAAVHSEQDDVEQEDMDVLVAPAPEPLVTYPIPEPYNPPIYYQTAAPAIYGSSSNGCYYTPPQTRYQTRHYYSSHVQESNPGYYDVGPPHGDFSAGPAVWA